MKSKTRLGKGLDALISTPVDQIAPKLKKALHEIDVGLIDPNPFQPRMEMDSEAFEELKNSVREKGIIQPVAVRPVEDGRYQLIAGERRLKAAIAVGLKWIPAYILDITSDEDMLEMALVENVQREHLNPIDLANGYQRLIDEVNLTQEEVAEKIGKDRATVANMLRLLKLPEKIQESLKKGEIREGHARALLGMPDSATQIELWKKVVKNGYSVRKVEDEVKKARDGSPHFQLQKQARKKSPFVSRTEGNLREKFGTQVKLHTKKDGGSIEIFFYSREDLDRLLELFDEIKI
ncbi:MAG: ParB/RepB/Spo0J family partition protein [Calditrichaeota bacterium]|nr:ParB/RepB/Spo0J family partition protein [Calditrichota bacterium]RQW03380.1 MAG: ParB/RepB/Spo0J family partition protein [Calditrichota bacterium]